MQTVTFNVEGMSCNHCVNAIEGALQTVNASGKADLEKKTVHVEFDENEISLGAIRKAIEDQGYDVE